MIQHPRARANPVPTPPDATDWCQRSRCDVPVNLSTRALHALAVGLRHITSALAVAG